MNESRVSNFWGVSGPTSIQEAFLKDSLESRHSFPAIGCWDGTPFGYFEIYWVKEDILGKHLNAGEANDFDRGVHVLVGEAKYRGQHRVVCWISALAHWALTADNRTNNVVLEPRIDNERYASSQLPFPSYLSATHSVNSGSVSLTTVNYRFIQHLQDAGFSKEKEITFPHKQAVYMRMRREEFDGPAL